MDRKKKKIIFISTFVVGMIMLVVGAVFLVLSLTRGAVVADGEYLVSAGEWTLNMQFDDDSHGDAIAYTDEKVVWDFTEIGKGVLTTNGHKNDYDFIWALEDGKLLIETDWLYDLENEYKYDLNQGEGVLTLTADNGTKFKFVAKQ